MGAVILAQGAGRSHQQTYSAPLEGVVTFHSSCLPDLGPPPSSFTKAIYVTSVPFASLGSHVQTRLERKDIWRQVVEVSLKLVLAGLGTPKLPLFIS